VVPSEPTGAVKSEEPEPVEPLTATEREILKSIALGKTTKEVASERYLSVYTVMTHRKNIFRKLRVNNLHEATKYAMRAGLVDMAEYCI
jgi:DNA-binding NarL/FixJ family response regulator